jgi:hypothetical protein
MSIGLSKIGAFAFGMDLDFAGRAEIRLAVLFEKRSIER